MCLNNLLTLFVLFVIVTFAPQSPAEDSASPSLTEQSLSCLSDFSCPADRARSLYQEAVAKDDPSVDCIYLYYGTIVERELGKAFRCFERSVQKEEPKCTGGASPSMNRLYLASMLMSGQGGAAGPEKVEALFAECFQDLAVQVIVNAAKQRIGNKEMPAYDFCAVPNGTTLSIRACHEIKGEREQIAGLFELKKVVARLDARGQEKFRAADLAWTDFAKKSAAFYAGSEGSIVQVRYPAYLAEKRKARARAIAQFWNYTPKEKQKTAALESLNKTLEDYLAKALATAGSPEDQKKLREAQTAWIAFREAEAELFSTVFGEKFGADAVGFDIKFHLTRSRVKDLKPLRS